VVLNGKDGLRKERDLRGNKMRVQGRCADLRAFQKGLVLKLTAQDVVEKRFRKGTVW
jgi:hypothetical protein